MCIAFPGRVIEVDASGALVETDGRRRRASVFLIPDIAVGDWVAVAAGSIVDRLDEGEAAEIKALLDRANQPADSGVRVAGIRGDRHVHAS
jgi:hydrogenase expression/formation protein HypC